MEHPRITFVLSGKTYSIDAGDATAIRNMPVDDRRHLINLLEAVKRQHSLSLTAVANALDKSKVSQLSLSGTASAASKNTSAGATPIRLGSGDIDALMARLVVEERHSRKQGLTRTGIYKITGGFLLLIFLLVIFV